VQTLYEFHRNPLSEDCLLRAILCVLEGSTNTFDTAVDYVEQNLQLHGCYPEVHDKMRHMVTVVLTELAEVKQYGLKELQEIVVLEFRNLNLFLSSDVLAYFFGLRTERKEGLDRLASLVLTPKTEEPVAIEKATLKRPDAPSMFQAPTGNKVFDSYFIQLPKAAMPESDNYFKPFQSKPHTCMRHAFEFRSRKRTAGYLSRCYAVTGDVSLLKLKLLQFWEDVRPAFFGMQSYI
jgi:hypothetical protein